MVWPADVRTGGTGNMNGTSMRFGLANRGARMRPFQCLKEQPESTTSCELELNENKMLKLLQVSISCSSLNQPAMEQGTLTGVKPRQMYILQETTPREGKIERERFVDRLTPRHACIHKQPVLVHTSAPLFDRRMFHVSHSPSVERWGVVAPSEPKTPGPMFPQQTQPGP